MDNFLDLKFLDVVLNKFTVQLFNSIDKLVDPMLYILTLLAIIELTTMWNAFFGERKFSELINFIMKVGFFTFLITNWQEMVLMVMETFEMIALYAGNETKFANTPSAIIAIGYSSVSDALSELVKNESASGFSMTLVLSYLVLFGILLVFVFIALQVLLIKTEYILMSTIAIVLLPFGVNRHTSFIAQKVFNFLFASGIKVMSIILLLLILTPIFKDLIPDQITNVQDDLVNFITILISAILLGFTVWKIPSYVANLLAGTTTGGFTSIPIPSSMPFLSRLGGNSARSGSSVSSGKTAHALR